MLIGGRHCQSRQCVLKYFRFEGPRRERRERRKTFSSNDKTIKFFTKYGFCRQKRSHLPTLPDSVSSVGAVAMPDGRVLICGGVATELTRGSMLEARNSTDCWYWVHGSHKIKRLELYSKLPYNWLGPFTAKQMQLVEFKQPIRNEDTEEYWEKEIEEEKKRIRPDSHEVEYEWDLGTTKEKTEEETASAGTTTTPKPSPKTDDVDDEELSFFANFAKLKNVMEFYRIIILPWPPYTDAFRKNRHNRLVKRGGDLIEGQLKITSYGPRIFWKKHRLQDMPIGYGGCYVVQRLYTGDVRIHTFGGREVFVDERLRDQGWTQNPHHLTKIPRYFDIGLNKSIDLTRTDLHANTTSDILLLTPNASVIRPVCEGDNFEDRRRRQRAHLVLEEDRIFYTCHLLPVPHLLDKKRTYWHLDIVLLGGGTATFFDRQRILEADYPYTPIYRSVARYDLKPNRSHIYRCNRPEMSGRGRWIQEDKTFGYGFNIPRTRHASEIIRTTDVLNPKKVTHTIFVFGGYTIDYQGGTTLDTIESLELGTKNNFYLHDANETKNEWLFRLPWPLMDITTVKIPVEWLPPECYLQYARSRRQETLARKRKH